MQIHAVSCHIIRPLLCRVADIPPNVVIVPPAFAAWSHSHTYLVGSFLAFPPTPALFAPMSVMTLSSVSCIADASRNAQHLDAAITPYSKLQWARFPACGAHSPVPTYL